MSRPLKWALLLCIVAGCSVPEHGPVVLPLQKGWTLLRNSNGETVPASVPGTVQLDLMHAGMLPDAWQGTNADSTLWVAGEEWTYTLRFDAPQRLLQQQVQELVFHGVDTYARIALNGRVLAKTANMFRTYRLPVQGLLRAKDNLLEVHILPVITEGAKAMERHGTVLPADNDEGDPKVCPYVRKAGYHFGWDFVPRTLPCGIWRPVELHGRSAAHLGSVHVRQEHDDGGMRVSLDAVWEGALGRNATLRAFWNGEPAGHLVLDGREQAGSATLPLELSDTARWWPNGHGRQALHRLRVELSEGERTVSVWERAIGLRTVALEQGADSIGTRFTVVVNGIPMFMKGVNVVPPDVHLPRAGDQAWVRMVQQMQAIGVNMVRVWGGGVYPPDAFFHACDSAGILVWQDLMFANAMYPASEAFLREAEAEVREQVLRLRHHASLALWCGNNEVEVAWKHWGWQQTYALSEADQERIWAAHRTIFHELVPQTIAALDDRPYVPTSPLSNWGNAEGLRHGNLHYWGVWHGDEPLEAFARNVGRFVSEWGFQSYPSLSDLAKWNGGSDPALGTPFWASRQRSYKGDGAIRNVTDRYGLPSGTAEELVLASQWCQAYGYALAIAAHRMAEPHCMGSLLWQWNDVWPGASWSITGHDGSPKPALYAVAGAFADTLLWLEEREGRAKLRLRRWDVWDSMALHVRLFHADGHLLWADTVMMHAHGTGTVEEDVTPPARLLAAHGPQELVLFADAGADHDPLRYQRWLTWGKPGRFSRGDIEFAVRSEAGGKLAFRSPVPLLAVIVELDGLGTAIHGAAMAPDRDYTVPGEASKRPSIRPMW